MTTSESMAKLGLFASVLVWLASSPAAMAHEAERQLAGHALVDDLGGAVANGINCACATLSSAVADFRVPEGTQKFISIFISPPTGRMFRPGASRFGWKWLADRADADHDGVVSQEECPGIEGMFERLDRNRDGVLSGDDFDWSDRSPLVRQATQASQIMGKTDRDGNGQISAEEWQALFARAAQSKGYVSHQDLQEFFYPLAPTAPRRARSDLSMRWQRLNAFLRGDTGSILADGPSPGRRAPDFLLRTQDGAREVGLGQFAGKRPVVLVFGSFT